MPSDSTRNVSVTTGYVSLPAAPAKHVAIKNSTGVVVSVRKASETASNQEITLANGESVALQTAGNASEIQVKGASAASGLNYIIAGL